MKENDVIFALSKKYQTDSYAFIPQVRNQTGHSHQTRTADAVALSLWPSRGHELEGFEVKVSRSDWLNELKNHQKAEEIFQYCDRWWLVTGDKDIAKLDEIPKPWGWMALTESGIRVMKKAPQLKAKALSTGFVCAIFRRMQNICTSEAALKTIKDEAYARGKSGAESAWTYEKNRLEEFKKADKFFVDKLGISFTHCYDLEDRIDIIKEAMQCKSVGETIKRLERRLEQIPESCEDIATEAKKELEKIKKQREKQNGTSDSAH